MLVTLEFEPRDTEEFPSQWESSWVAVRAFFSADAEFRSDSLLRGH